jgi:hypothetical protein
VHASASAAWHRFIRKDEGEVAYMYLDKIGLVTTGVGNLIDPIAAALTLPFRFRANNRHRTPTGQMATQADITTEWKFIKNHPDRSEFIRLGHRKVEPVASLELDAADRRVLFDDKTTTNERILSSYFNDFTIGLRTLRSD